MSDLTSLLTSALAVRSKLDRTGKSKAKLGNLTKQVAYWIATSKNVEKTALLRRKEILIVLPPNYVGKFQEIMDKIEKNEKRSKNGANIF